MVWLPAEFYENQRFYVQVTGEVGEYYFNHPRTLKGYLLPTNIYPNYPGQIITPNKDVPKFREYNFAQMDNREGVSVLNGYAVGQFIYTPTQLVRTATNANIHQLREAIGPAYRPIVGLLFLSVNSHSKRQNTGEYLFTEYKFGLWGKYSFARDVQGAFHAVIGYTDNRIYKYQLDPTIPFFLQYSVNYRKDFISSSYGLKVGYLIGGDVGTLMMNANVGMLLKIGHFENQRLLKYSYILNKAPVNFIGRNIKLFAYVKPTINGVAMNGLLSSSLLSPRNRREEVEKLLPLSAINPVYLKFEAGFGFRIAEQITVNYTWVAQGPEYIGQPNNMYSRLFIRLDY
jgi:hypothetical protein